MSRQVDLKALVSHIVRGDGLDKCRICMGDTSEGQVHLTDTVMMDGDQAVTLSELLEVVTGVEIVEESACPAGVCEACTRGALDAQHFRAFARRAHAHWHALSAQLHALPEHRLARGAGARSLCAVLAEGAPVRVYENSPRAPRPRPRPRRAPAGPAVACPACSKQCPSPQLLRQHLQNCDDRDACAQCGAGVPRGAGLRDHMLAAHGRRHLLCADCPTVAEDAAQLRRHRELAHAARAHTCLACGRTFARASALEAHARVHAVLACRACGAQFSNRACYRVHRAACEPRGARARGGRNARDPGRFECDACGACYTSRPQLQNHIVWLHLQRRPHACAACGKRFYTAARLAEHAVVHSRERRFRCEFCPARLVSRSAALYHTRRHTGEKPYACAHCDARFPCASRRTEHAKRRHNLGPRFQCRACPASFVRTKELERHRLKAHPGGGGPPPPAAAAAPHNNATL